VCAALARGESRICNASDSDDTALLCNALNQLGVLVRRDGDALVVSGTGGKLYSPKFPIPVGNAGTSLRFLLSLAALAKGTTVINVSPRMVERPNEDLLIALNDLGIKVGFDKRAALFSVRGGSISGGIVRMRADKSSQFLSSVLMVAPFAASDLRVAIEGNLISSAYVEMTKSVMNAFGVHVEEKDGVISVPSPQRYQPTEYPVEADASSASYFVAAAMIAGGEVIIDGMTANSIQGDAGFVDLVRRMGDTVSLHAGDLTVKGSDVIAGVDVDMNNMPDLVPTVAVCALFANSATRIRNVAQLRYKESDRLEALKSELEKIGAEVKLTDDGMEISPAALHGAQLDTYDDHRLAMSFSLIGLRVPGISIENPACVGKSFPRFWKEFEKLYQRAS
jgi:3-phosphoshikimate 1-carboxyvinyltransferase